MTEAHRQSLAGQLSAYERELERLLFEIGTLRYQRQSMRDPPPLTPASRLERAADRATWLMFEVDAIKADLGVVSPLDVE